MSRKTVFWGAGEAGRLSLGYASTRHIDVDCFIDANPEKWGTNFKGVKVYPPEHVHDFNGDVEIIVTVGPKRKNEVIARLSEMGFVYGKRASSHTTTSLLAAIPCRQCLSQDISICALTSLS